jgi:SHS2 domain-containing protein
MSVEYLEHTADIRLRISSANQSELFKDAAAGMMAYIYGETTHFQPHCFQEVQIVAADLESLLVDWLSKLLTLSSLNYSCCMSFDMLEVGPSRIRAKVGLAPAEAQEEIKAVTYNDLQVTKSQERWAATITFDI